jgi:hypothetical protein
MLHSPYGRHSWPSVDCAYNPQTQKLGHHHFHNNRKRNAMVSHCFYVRNSRHNFQRKAVAQSSQEIEPHCVVEREGRLLSNSRKTIHKKQLYPSAKMIRKRVIVTNNKYEEGEEVMKQLDGFLRGLNEKHCDIVSIESDN